MQATETTTTTQWFTRDGSEHTGAVYSVNVKAGSAEYSYFRKCSRCGGAGGSSKWAQTGWTCFECGGRRGEMDTAKVYTAEKLAKLNGAQEKRDAAKREAHRIESERKEAERLANLATNRERFDAEYPGAAAELEAFASQDAFIGNIFKKLSEFGTLTPRQVEASLASVAELKRRATTQFIGEVGTRAEFTLTLQMKMRLESNGPWGAPMLYILKDAAGNTFKYVGNLVCHKDHCDSWADVHAVITLKATIKDHATYNGEKQTVLSNPRVSDIKNKEEAQ